MTSSNGNIFRVTGPLCGEFTGPGEFPTQRPVTRCFDVFFDLRLNKRLSKQPWGWWFEMPSWSLWRQCNGSFCSSPSVLLAVPVLWHVLWCLTCRPQWFITATNYNGTNHFTQELFRPREIVEIFQTTLLRHFRQAICLFRSFYEFHRRLFLDMKMCCLFQM